MLSLLRIRTFEFGEISANFEHVTGIPPSAFDKVEDNTNRTNIYIDDILRVKTTAYSGCPIEELIKVHQVREKLKSLLIIWMHF
jgi:hypothetical protein